MPDALFLRKFCVAFTDILHCRDGSHYVRMIFESGLLLAQDKDRLFKWSKK